MPLPLLVAVAAASAIFVGKKIYDASQEDSVYSSSTSGPSAEELREEQRQDVFRQAKENFTQFCITQEDILCVKNNDQQAFQEIAGYVRDGKLSVKKAEKKLSEIIIDKHTYMRGFDGWENIEVIIAHPPKSIDDLVRKFSEIHLFLPFNNKNRYNILLNPNYNLLFSESKIEQLVPLCEEAIASVAIPKELFRIARFQQPLLELCDTAQTLIEAQCDAPRIVVCGMLKAGKSSLLNNLVGSLDDALFPIDIVRATTKNKEFLHEGICFVDTPGLEANKIDTEEAQKAYLTADMLLFVHHAESELSQQEAQWLSDLQGRREDLAQRVLLVLTNADSAGDNLDRLKAKVDGQVRDALGVGVPIQVVDNKAYKKSFMPGKEILRQSSGIDQLRMTIAHLRATTLANFATEQKNKIYQSLASLQEWTQDFAEQTKAARKNQQDSHAKLLRVFFNRVIKPAKAALKNIEG